MWPQIIYMYAPLHVAWCRCTHICVWLEPEHNPNPNPNSRSFWQAALDKHLNDPRLSLDALEAMSRCLQDRAREALLIHLFIYSFIYLFIHLFTTVKGLPGWILTPRRAHLFIHLSRVRGQVRRLRKQKGVRTLEWMFRMRPKPLSPPPRPDSSPH